MNKINKNEEMRKAIKALVEPHFTVSDIYEAVKSFGINRRHVQRQLCHFVKKGYIRRIAGTGGGRAATYTRELVKSPRHEQKELPLDLPMHKVGEAILASFQLLKRQVAETQEKLDKARADANNARSIARELRKVVEKKNDELEAVREALRQQTGKTFPMSEVARIITNGKFTPANPSFVR